MNSDSSDLSRQDVETGLIYRYNDYNRYSGDDCIETDQLRVFINNVVKLDQNSQTTDHTSLDMFNSQTYYYTKHKEEVQ